MEHKNRLTWVKDTSKRASNGNTIALYKCVCGLEKEIRKSSVNYGATRSCGCLKREVNKVKAKKMGQLRNIKHGMTDSPIYRSWAAMLQRCTNKSNNRYQDYGGRGITVCDEWNSFEKFYEDMGGRPLNTTLDRIKNDKGYSKENCRWATRLEQSRNTRVVKLDMVKARKIRGLYSDKDNKLSYAKLGKMFNVSRGTIHSVVSYKTWKV